MATYLEALSQPGVAVLQLVRDEAKEQPILLVEEIEGESLVAEFSAIRDCVPSLRGGEKFTISGFTSGGHVCTSELHVKSFKNEEGDRLLGFISWPERLFVKQRRTNFRATLRIGMEVGVCLRSSQEQQKEPFELQGDLRDLSADGCLVEFSIFDGASRVLPLQTNEIELYFPNGRTITLLTEVRHVRQDTERKVLAVGFEFRKLDKELEKVLWNIVKEIERESSRSASSGDSRSPSELFRQRTESKFKVGRRRGYNSSIPMANRLANIAGYLDGQMVMLSQQGTLDTNLLSMQTDHLLELLKEDREAMLYALRCLYRESRWVQHGLAVAVYLADLLRAEKVPDSLLKGATAAAMIHDLGKGVVSPDIWRATTLSREMYLEMQTHVTVVAEEAKKIKWMAPIIAANVVQQINERLDGSGYPNQLKGQQIGQLARAAMVVDAMDALQRPRPDRPAISSIAALEMLRQSEGRFDQKWWQRYRARFGVIPIGSLVRFEKGQCAWVVGLDADNRINRVRLAVDKKHPDKFEGDVFEGSRFHKLGRLREILTVAD